MKIRAKLIITITSVIILSGCMGEYEYVSEPDTRSTETRSSTRVESEDATYGLVKIAANPSVRADVAKEICRRQAKLAGSQADSQYRPRSSRYNSECRRDYFGNYDCSTSRYTPGGFYGGLAEGMRKATIRKEAEEAEFLACLAPMGWTSR